MDDDDDVASRAVVVMMVAEALSSSILRCAVRRKLLVLSLASAVVKSTQHDRMEAMINLIRLSLMVVSLIVPR